MKESDRHRKLDRILAREWLRIFLFSGLKGVEINRWYVGLVNERILERMQS